jgi:hypothetical protein
LGDENKEKTPAGEEMLTGFWCGNPWLKTTLGGPKRRWGIILEWILFFFLSFRVSQLMILEAPQTYGLLYYPRIGLSNFLHQVRATMPPKQRKMDL